MPNMIVTDQPEMVRKTLQVLLTDDWIAVAEAPYFSIPLTSDDTVAVEDPSDSDRELRQGEIFFATGIQIANTSGTTRSVEVEMIGETGVTTSLSPGLMVPGNDVLTLAPGLSIFKSNLAAPDDPAQRVRVRASASGALTLTATVVERERLQHSPDTESV